MKRSFYRSPDHQKWALFVLLTATLGFTLSMNPDHFNNIARHEIGSELHTMDLAATASQGDVRRVDNKIDADAKAAEEAETAESTSTESNSTESKSTESKPARKTETRASTSSSTRRSTPPGESDSLPADMIVEGNGRRYQVSFTKENQVAKANFKALGDTEGQPCPICDLSARVQSSLDKTEDLFLEMKAIATGKLNAAQASSKTEEKIAPQKKGEATEVDLAKWAEKCEKIEDDSKLDCHKTRLIELSKYLKNSSETDSLMKEYFTTYLQEELNRAFKSRTIKETAAGSCEGTIVYTGSYGRVGCQSDALEKAGEVAEEIMNGIRAGNGKSVVAALTKMRAGSFSAQLRNSQILAIEGTNEKNMAKVALGFRGMDATTQTWLLNKMNSDMMGSIQGMQGTAGQKSALEALLEQNFYSPVNSMLLDLKNYVMGTNMTTPGQSRNILDYPIQPIGDDKGSQVPYNASNPNYTPGMPGNIPASLQSRLSAPTRTSNLAQYFASLSNLPGGQSTLTNTNGLANPLLQPSSIFNQPQQTTPAANPAIANGGSRAR